MSESYCEAAGLIPAEQVLDKNSISHFYAIFQAACERAWRNDAGFPFCVEAICQFKLEFQDDRSLYWASIDYFETEQFCEFIFVCIKRGWLAGPISGTVSWFCSKPMPDSFGGLYFRVTDNASHIITTNLDHLPEPQLAQLEMQVNTRQFLNSST